MEKMIQSLAELEAEAARFVAELSPQEGGATLVTLSGDLGAGKTAFTKAVAKALGIKENITSPTFVLEKIYQLSPKYGFTKPVFKRLVHIDAYRLESGAELSPLGFDETMRDTENLILLEWPEKVSDALPTPTMRLSFSVLPDDSRVITYG